MGSLGAKSKGEDWFVQTAKRARGRTRTEVPGAQQTRPPAVRPRAKAVGYSWSQRSQVTTCDMNNTCRDGHALNPTKNSTVPVLSASTEGMKGNKTGSKGEQRGAEKGNKVGEDGREKKRSKGKIWKGNFVNKQGKRS